VARETKADAGQPLCTIETVITRAYEPIPLPLLITGVAGVAGFNAFQYFRARYPGQVIAIRQEDNWPLTGKGIVPCNAEDHGRLRALFDEYQFRSVLNCAGICALRACELESRVAWRTQPWRLVRSCTRMVGIGWIGRGWRRACLPGTCWNAAHK
jgi:hypothetical protein